jgi:hypothetical protein
MRAARLDGRLSLPGVETLWKKTFRQKKDAASYRKTSPRKTIITEKINSAIKKRFQIFFLLADR